MANVSRPLIAVLVATVAFFAIWMLALKPSSSTNNGGPQGVSAYSSAVAKARHAVAVSSGTTAAGAASVGTTPAGTQASTTSSTSPATGSTTPAGGATTPAGGS